MIFQTFVICEKEIRSMLHDPTEILVRLLRPVLWLLLFGNVFRALSLRGISPGLDYQQYILPGVLVNAVLVMAVAHGITLRWEADVGILSRMLVAPVWRISIVLGKALSSVAKALLETSVIMIFAIIIQIKFSYDWAALLLSCVFVSIFVVGIASLGMALAILLRSREAYIGVIGLISTPSFFASNSLYGLDQMPSWLRALAVVNPVTYVVDAIRRVLIFHSFDAIPIAQDTATALLFSSAMLIFTVTIFHRMR
jgi:ABC-2 type transport system permease protein